MRQNNKFNVWSETKPSLQPDGSKQKNNEENLNRHSCGLRRWCPVDSVQCWLLVIIYNNVLYKPQKWPRKTHRPIGLRCRWLSVYYHYDRCIRRWFVCALRHLVTLNNTANCRVSMCVIDRTRIFTRTTKHGV